jgi:hypothetical protein
MTRPAVLVYIVDPDEEHLRLGIQVDLEQFESRQSVIDAIDAEIPALYKSEDE